MSAKVWNETAELPEATTWLLEASAGTGKTYQIAGLFVLLVAEYGVPVEGILAITFTKAATAELRDRIRAHLREALARLRAPAQESDDGVVRRLRKHPAPPEVETRLELALRSFDLAPISTIHGFAQRMLQEFAFDSGTDPDLELLQDTSAVTQELVDDALASFFATASAEEVAFYGSAGFTRKLLVDTARAMCGATVREVRPAGVCERAAEKAALAALRDQARALGLRWNGAEGALAYAALAADVDAKLSDGNKLRAGSLGGYWQAVGTWLGRGAPLPDSETMNKVRRVRSTAVAAVWKAASPPVGERGWWLFCEAYDAFFVEHERFWDSFSPLATFARTVRERMEAELARRRALTFDSMLSRLAERIGAEGGVQSPIAKRIRERFQAVLVDEFQDTDAAQWKIIEAAFRDHRRLFLIGDPKQAIYAFRGADVHVYLEAKGAVDDPQHFTLGYNWRSDPQAVEAMNHLWREGSGAFGEDAIDYVNVEAKRTVRLTQPGAGLQLRWLDDHADDGVQGEPLPRKDNGLAARLAAEEVLAWLRGQRGLLEDEEGWRDPGPGDFAVLVNSHFEAQVAHWALTRLNVPAVAASKESVFSTPVAGWLAAWLEAVASGGRDREARSAVVREMPAAGIFFASAGPRVKRARSSSRPAS